MTDKVGLILFVERKGVVFAVLQRRGETNFEEDWKSESWAGGLQVTCHGRCNDGESSDDALVRECREELGPAIAITLRKRITDCQILSADDAPAVTIGLFVVSEDIERLRLHPSSGGLKVLREEALDQIKQLKEFDKTKPVPQNVMAMHADEIDALRRGFEIFSKR